MNRSLLIALRHLITEADNATVDLFRILAIAGQMVFLGLAIWNHGSFEPVSFGAGFGAVLVATGAAVRLNEGGKTSSGELKS